MYLPHSHLLILWVIILLHSSRKVWCLISSYSFPGAKLFCFSAFSSSSKWDSMRHFIRESVPVHITRLTCHGLLETKTPFLDQLSAHTGKMTVSVSYSRTRMQTRTQADTHTNMHSAVPLDNLKMGEWCER